MVGRVVGSSDKQASTSGSRATLSLAMVLKYVLAQKLSSAFDEPQYHKVV